MPEMRRRSRDSVNRPDLSWRQIAVHSVTEHFDKPDDRCQRRTELMRDVRKELTFHGVGAKRLDRETLDVGRPLGYLERMLTFSRHADSEQQNAENADSP